MYTVSQGAKEWGDFEAGRWWPIAGTQRGLCPAARFVVGAAGGGGWGCVEEGGGDESRWGRVFIRCVVAGVAK